MVFDMKVFILSTYLTTLDTGELEVNDTVDSKDNLEEKTGEVDGKSLHDSLVCTQFGHIILGHIMPKINIFTSHS